jgi:hypothetical protein
LAGNGRKPAAFYLLGYYLELGADAFFLGGAGRQSMPAVLSTWPARQLACCIFRQKEI